MPGLDLEAARAFGSLCQSVPTGGYTVGRLRDLAIQQLELLIGYRIRVTADQVVSDVKRYQR